jgi:hypothetical protein
MEFAGGFVELVVGFIFGVGSSLVLHPLCGCYSPAALFLVLC